MGCLLGAFSPVSGCSSSGHQTELVNRAFHGGSDPAAAGRSSSCLVTTFVLRGRLRPGQRRRRAGPGSGSCWGCWSTWACMAPVYRATEATIAAFRLLVGRTPDSRARDATLANCARYGSRRLLPVSHLVGRSRNQASAALSSAMADPIRRAGGNADERVLNRCLHLRGGLASRPGGGGVSPSLPASPTSVARCSGESGSEAARVWSALENVKIATAPRMASASTCAERVTALLTPDARPECSDGAEDITAVVSGATVMPMPTPIARMPGNRSTSTRPGQ